MNDFFIFKIYSLHSPAFKGRAIYQYPAKYNFYKGNANSFFCSRPLQAGLFYKL